MMRKVLIEARPERRTLKTEAADAVVKFKQAELDLEERKPTMRDAVKAIAVDVEVFLGYSAWKTSQPPCDGWYDTRCEGGPFPAPGHVERLWFEADEGADGVGVWKETDRNTTFMLFTRAHESGLEWRGLAAPWPWGYRRTRAP